MNAPDIKRRAVLGGLAAAPLAAVLADARLARAAAETLEDVTLTTPSGRKVHGALALPEVTPAPTVLMIHEWWGLNDQIKAVAHDLARLGYVALACDLFDGQVATTPDAARAQMQAVAQNPDPALETLVAWVDWLRQNPKGTGKVGTCGWCFGGGWSLNVSLATPIDATVMYYGQVKTDKAALAPLAGPLLGHFAEQDKHIKPEKVREFASVLDELDKAAEIYFYDAGHAFANPTGNNYDKADAQLAWERTKQFLGVNLVPA